MRPWAGHRWLLVDTAVLVFCVAVVFFVQWKTNAYGGDLGITDDAGAHYVSGVMIGQYLLSLLNFEFWNPIRFAENYYVRYPKLGIGQWPPGFYVLEGVWTLLFGPSRESVMLMMALIAIAVLFLGYWTASRLLGRRMAPVALGLLLLSAPVWWFSSRVNLDSLVVVASLAAAFAFARYAETPRRRTSAVWSAAAAAAILIKGNALALAFLPPFYVLIARRFRLLRRADFWAPCVLVAVFCAPWYAFTWDVWTRVNVGQDGSLVGLYAGLLRALPHSWALVPITAVAGMIMACGKEASSPARRFPNVLAALVAAWMFFHMLTPIGASFRKHILTVAVLLAFSVLFLDRAAAWIARAKVPRTISAGVLILAMAWAVCPGKFHWAPKPEVMKVVAGKIIQDAALRDAAILVSSPGAGEGSFIAEMAAREPAPRRYLLRASQLLARGDWYDHDYRLLDRTPEAILDELDAIPVAAVVVDHRPAVRIAPHHELLVQTLQQHPERWELVGVFPADASDAAITASLYRRRGEIRPLVEPPAVYSGTLGRYINPR